jgi:hypothetical protein
MTLRSWTVAPLPNKPVIHGCVAFMITPTDMRPGSLMQALIEAELQEPLE